MQNLLNTFAILLLKLGNKLHVPVQYLFSCWSARINIIWLWDPTLRFLHTSAWG